MSHAFHIEKDLEEESVFGTKDGGISWYQTAWRIKYKVDEQWLRCHADTDMRQSTNISRPWGVKADPLRIRFQNSSHLRR